MHFCKKKLSIIENIEENLFLQNRLLSDYHEKNVYQEFIAPIVGRQEKLNSI